MPDRHLALTNIASALQQQADALQEQAGALQALTQPGDSDLPIIWCVLLEAIDRIDFAASAPLDGRTAI